MVSILTPYHYARKKIVRCRTDDSLASCARKMVDENIGSLIVEDPKGELAGILTNSMILAVVSEGRDPKNLKASDLKLDPAVTASRDAKIEDIVERFRETGCKRIVLTDEGGRVAGILKKDNLERFSRFDLASKIYGKERV